MTPQAAAAIATRIRQSLQELKQTVDRADRLRQKAVTSGDADYWDAVALNLHSFYTGVEQIFEDVARTIDRSIPEGANWHRDLLLQMAGELGEVRPAVIGRETRLFG